MNTPTLQHGFFFTSLSFTDTYEHTQHRECIRVCLCRAWTWSSPVRMASRPVSSTESDTQPACPSLDPWCCGMLSYHRPHTRHLTLPRHRPLSNLIGRCLFPCLTLERSTTAMARPTTKAPELDVSHMLLASLCVVYWDQAGVIMYGLRVSRVYVIVYLIGCCRSDSPPIVGWLYTVRTCPVLTLPHHCDCMLMQCISSFAMLVQAQMSAVKKVCSFVSYFVMEACLSRAVPCNGATKYVAHTMNVPCAL